MLKLKSKSSSHTQIILVLLKIAVFRFSVSSPSGNRLPRIVSGKIAEPNEFPFAVRLGDKKSGSSFCGGTIINEKTILTAAHCVVDEKDPPFNLLHLIITPTPKYTQKAPIDVYVVAGEHRIDRKDGTEQFRNVVKITTHPDYRGNREAYDLAILELQKPLKFNKYVKAAELATRNYVAIGFGTIIGWGVSTRDGTTSNVLRKARVPIIPELVCKLNYDDFRIFSNICAGGSIQDTCYGDSGGPLLCGEEQTLCGVTSYGSGCGRLLRPGAYTKIAYFYDWIVKNSAKVTEKDRLSVKPTISKITKPPTTVPMTQTPSDEPTSSTVKLPDISAS